MPTPPVPESELRDLIRVWMEHNFDGNAAAEALGMKYKKFGYRLSIARAKGFHLSDGARDSATKAKLAPLEVRGGHRRVYDDDGKQIDTIRYTVPQDAESVADFKELLREEIAFTPAIPLPERFDESEGRMLVLDPSDVHIGKLSIAAETGYTYDASVAEHRLFTGCKALIDDARKMGVTHVLLVIGNDISHIDKPRRETTSGTPQDTDGSIFTIFRAARNAYARVVRYALECGLSVQIVHVPSNHDWVLGYCIAETLAALFSEHPNVTATEYAISERHRKYVRFGKNLIGLTHGDGAKEGDLSQIMLQEARPHMAECLHRYWYVHHYHHKIKKALGIRPMAREKDHIAMTVIQGGAGAMEGDNVAVEYVRSPSPPDGWHDRNGYLNRQAVEAFIHCPERGQIRRLTEWF